MKQLWKGRLTTTDIAKLINQESKDIDVIENMNRISINTKPIENVDSLVPIYLKDR